MDQMCRFGQKAQELNICQIQLLNLMPVDYKSNTNMQANDSLLTGYEGYQEEYNNKCTEWRSEPVANRTCNDIGCVVFFFVFLGVFIAGGAYYINLKGDITLPNDIYVSQYAGEIAVCLAIALVLSFVYVFLVKLMPKVMVYTLMVLSMAILFGLAIFGFVIGQLGIAIPFLVIFILYALVLMCLRKKIDMGIILVKVASQFLSQKWGVFLSPIIKVVVNVIFTFFWIYSLNCILAVSDDKSKKSPPQDNTLETVVSVIWFFIWLFFSFLFYYIMVFTVAVSCAFWYYRVEGQHYLVTAYKWLFKSAFGSIVFGAALIAVITLARMIVDSKRRENKNIAVAVCLCIVSMCLRNLENLFKILNHNAVIVMSVTGENYINSAKTTIGILSRFFGLMSVSDIITGLLVFWGVVLITGVTAVISYFWLDSKQGLSSGDMAMLMVISILGSIMVSTLVFSVLVEAVSSVFIFYCFDIRFREMGYASNNMPAEINEALGSTNFEAKQ